ncbi:MAG TPA: serine/threonine-protein kinase [Polyangia bacterium]
MAGELQTIKPARFGRYILLDRIGVGGMAEVFRAVMPGPEGFKRTFVVKRIVTQLCQSPTFVEMFVREARIGALLNHPNIAQVFDFGSVDGEYFLAMEYIRGADILAMMRRLRETKQRLPIPVAVFVAHQVASGLAYAHGLRGADGEPMNLIHRDVTPSNIMCLRTGGVKLLDFGIAKTVDASGIESTEKGEFRGKLAYMAPERVRDQPFDARSDIYSLGVVLWELLTGRRLFRGGTDVETFKNVLEMEVRAPSTLRPEVPASLDAVVARALARDPDERFATAQAMLDALEPILPETKYQSRMISDLLGTLYGKGVHSSQIALACVTPELLASVSEGSSASRPGRTGSAESPALTTAANSSLAFAPTAAPEARPRRVKLGWSAAVAGAALAATVALVATRGGDGASRAATMTVVPATSVPAVIGASRTAAPHTIVPAAPAEAAHGPSAAAPEAEALPVEATVETPPTPPTTRPEPVRRAARATKLRAVTAAPHPAASPTRKSDDVIASGGSIDPFAEAAQRSRPATRTRP